jgi:hypothetical protein
LTRKTRQVLHAALGYILTLLDSLAYLANTLLANARTKLHGLTEALIRGGLELIRQVAGVVGQLPRLIQKLLRALRCLQTLL